MGDAPTCYRHRQNRSMPTGALFHGGEASSFVVIEKEIDLCISIFPILLAFRKDADNRQIAHIRFGPDLWFSERVQDLAGNQGFSGNLDRFFFEKPQFLYHF